MNQSSNVVPFTKETCINWILIGIVLFFVYFLLVSDTLVEGLDPTTTTTTTGSNVVADVVPSFNPQPTTLSQAEQATISSKPTLSVQDLLPLNPEATTFGQVTPLQNAQLDQNFLTSGYHVGIQTVGSSPVNANHDIRSLPVIEIPSDFKTPWGVASNLGERELRRPLDIGSASY
jgi:hypothetical protein